jgi:hypothetical protein
MFARRHSLPLAQTFIRKTFARDFLHENVGRRPYPSARYSRLTAAVTTTRRITATVALAVGALSLFPFSAAQAVEPAQSCWYNVDDDTMGCFDAALDPHEQIELATGAELVAVPTAGAQRGTASRVAAADPVVYLLATGWEAADYSGASISYYTSNALICNGVSHLFSTLQTWNNRFDSVQTYNSCEAYLYDSTSYNGAEFGPVTASPNLGTFANRAESMIVE